MHGLIFHAGRLYISGYSYKLLARPARVVQTAFVEHLASIRRLLQIPLAFGEGVAMSAMLMISSRKQLTGPDCKLWPDDEYKLITNDCL